MQQLTIQSFYQLQYLILHGSTRLSNIFLLSMIFLVLLVVYFVYTSNKEARKAKDNASDIWNKWQGANQYAESLRSQLSGLRVKVSTLNTQLQEANRSKRDLEKAHSYEIGKLKATNKKELEDLAAHLADANKECKRLKEELKTEKGNRIKDNQAHNIELSRVKAENMSEIQDLAAHLSDANEECKRLKNETKEYRKIEAQRILLEQELAQTKEKLTEVLKERAEEKICYSKEIKDLQECCREAKEKSEEQNRAYAALQVQNEELESKIQKLRKKIEIDRSIAKEDHATLEALKQEILGLKDTLSSKEQELEECNDKLNKISPSNRNSKNPFEKLANW